MEPQVLSPQKYTFARRATLLGLLAAFACAATLHAADRWWDRRTANLSGNGDGASAGSTGTWNTTIKNWTGGAVAHGAGNNGGNDTAVFAGTGAAISVASPISGGGLTYSVWTSPNLATWTEDPGAVQTPGKPDANGVQSVTVTVRACPESRSTAFQAVLRAGLLPADVQFSRLEACWPHRQDACVTHGLFGHALSPARLGGPRLFMRVSAVP